MINKTKTWFFEKTNKYLARLKKKEETNKNETAEITTDASEIKEITRDY